MMNRVVSSLVILNFCQNFHVYGIQNYKTNKNCFVVSSFVMEIEKSMKLCRSEVETDFIDDLFHAATANPFERPNYHFVLRELRDTTPDISFLQHDEGRHAHKPHFLHQSWSEQTPFLQLHNSEPGIYHHAEPHHSANTDFHSILTEDDLPVEHRHQTPIQIQYFQDPINIVPTVPKTLHYHYEPLQTSVSELHDESHLLETNLHHNHHHIQAILKKLRGTHVDERYDKNLNAKPHHSIAKRSFFRNWKQHQSLHFPAVISQMDRFHTGCLLQCVFKMNNAVDKFGYPTLDGLTDFLTAGTDEQSFFVYVLKSVNKCLKRASGKHQIFTKNPFTKGETCGVSFDVYDCVHDLMAEYCELYSE